MSFNIPLNLTHKNTLLLGIGGGYDIYGGVPLIFKWPTQDWVLANYNIRLNSLVDFHKEPTPGPETSLLEWLRGDDKPFPIYGLPKVGVNVMTKYIKKICDDHKIDTIVMMDGGVDSLMHGDEHDPGTIIEDTIVMAAAAAVPVAKKYLVCVGFGTELEEGLCHHHALQNIAELTKAGAFLGSCSLVKGMDEYQEYKGACENAWKNQRKSHVHTKVISAIEGEFGDSNLYEGVDAQVAGAEKVSNFITPLMGMYWFFDFEEVAKRNKLMAVMKNSNTHTDALQLYKASISKIRNRHFENLPY